MFTNTCDAIRRARLACVLVTLPVAGWEVFLRVDSQVLPTWTKLWFLPLLAFAVIAGSALFAAALARVSALVARGRPASSLLLLSTTAYSAALYGGEYLGVTYYHSPERLHLWPLAASAGAALMLALFYAPRSLTPRSLRYRPAPSIVGWLSVAAALLTLSSAAFAVARRHDLAQVILRPNTVVGRIGGNILFRLKPSLATRATSSVSRLPDRPSTHTFPSSNVILISIDTLRTDSISPYNPAVSVTPNIQRLADHSLIFDDAFTTRPTSAPSMASLMTSLYPANHGVRGNGMKLDDRLQTLAALLSDSGYATAGFVSNVNFSETFNFNHGFREFAFFEPKKDADGLLRDTADPQVVNAALEWARKHRHERIFLWAHLISPHSPYIPPRDLQPVLGSGVGDWFNVLNMPAVLARVEGRRTYFDRDAYHMLYMSEIMNVDRLVGRLLDGLATLDLLEDTHIIFVSDHGEAFGEADVFGHGRSLHAIESRVVLFWSFPHKYRSGTRIGETVQLVDLLPTLWNVLGKPPLTSIDGRVLSGILFGETSEDDGFAFTEAGYIGSLGRQGLKYAVRTRHRAIWLDAGLPYVVEFDRQRDPWESRGRRFVQSDDDPLFASLTALATEAESARMHPSRSVQLDENAKEQLRALGYM